VSAPPVVRLYPSGGAACPLQGLYLGHALRDRRAAGRPYVYTNFIASLDGRISEPVPGSTRRRVPSAIANPRDWRLYMELLAQCDAVLTTARHLRALAAGRQRELLDLGQGEYEDLGRWRRERHLPAQPLTVVVSAALEIPTQVHRQLPGGLLVLTTTAAPPDRLQALRDDGIEVLTCGGGERVDGTAAMERLHGRGIATVYSIAGPRVLHALLRAGLLDRLYLTLAQTLLAGDTFDTLTRGPALAPPPGFELYELYLDPHGPQGIGQLLMSFDADRRGAV